MHVPCLFEFSLATLAENSRLSKAQGVVKAYMTIMSAYRGEVPCTVTTATVSNSYFGELQFLSTYKRLAHCVTTVTVAYEC